MHHFKYTRGVLMVGIFLIAETLIVTAWIAHEQLVELQRISLWDAVNIGLIELIVAVMGTSLVLRRIIEPSGYTREGLVAVAGCDTGLDIPEPKRNDHSRHLPMLSGAHSLRVEGVAVMPCMTDAELPPVSGKILYIEDYFANLKLMEGIVRLSEGLTLISARYAEVGLEMAKTQNPDMIIIDINLPDMSGLVVLEKLMELDIVPRIPVIALSAAATDKDIKEGIDAGFQMYLTKPINVRQVQGAIHSLLAA